MAPKRKIGSPPSKKSKQADAQERNRGPHCRSLQEFIAKVENVPAIKVLLRELQIFDKNAKEKAKLYKTLMFVAENLKISVEDVADSLNQGAGAVAISDRLRKASILRMTSLACGFSNRYGNRKVEDTTPFCVKMMSPGGLTRVVVKSPTNEQRRFFMDEEIDVSDMLARYGAPLPLGHSLTDVFNIVDVNEHTRPLEANCTFEDATSSIGKASCWLYKVVEHLHTCSTCFVEFYNAEEKTTPLEKMLSHLFSHNGFYSYLSYRDYSDGAKVKATSWRDFCPYQYSTLPEADKPMHGYEVTHIDWEQSLKKMLPSSFQQLDGRPNENGEKGVAPRAKRPRRRGLRGAASPNPNDAFAADGTGGGVSSGEENDDDGPPPLKPQRPQRRPQRAVIEEKEEDEYVADEDNYFQEPEVKLEPFRGSLINDFVQINPDDDIKAIPAFEFREPEKEVKEEQIDTGMLEFPVKSEEDFFVPKLEVLEDEEDIKPEITH